MSPILPVIVQSFPDHLHDLRECDHVVGEVCDLRHLRAGGAPGVVTGGLPDFDLINGNDIIQFPTSSSSFLTWASV